MVINHLQVSGWSSKNPVQKQSPRSKNMTWALWCTVRWFFSLGLRDFFLSKNVSPKRGKSWWNVEKNKHNFPPKLWSIRDILVGNVRKTWKKVYSPNMVKKIVFHASHYPSVNPGWNIPIFQEETHPTNGGNFQPAMLVCRSQHPSQKHGGNCAKSDLEPCTVSPERCAWKPVASQVPWMEETAKQSNDHPMPGGPGDFFSAVTWNGFLWPEHKWVCLGLVHPTYRGEITPFLW